MPRIKKFNKNPFRGNQLSSKSNPQQAASTEPRPLASPKKSSSYKTINNSRLPNCKSYNVNNVNFRVDLGQISRLISSFTKCKFCDSCDSIELTLDEDFKSGIIHRMVLRCNSCHRADKEISSKCVRRAYELNLRYSYALRSLGEGMQAGDIFCGNEYGSADYFF